MGRRAQNVDRMEKRHGSVSLCLPTFMSWWGSPLALGEYLHTLIPSQPLGSKGYGMELWCPFLTTGFES